MHCSKAATLEILCKSWLRLQPAACLSSNMSDLSDIVNTSSWCHGHSLLEYHLNQNLHLWWFNSWLVTFLGWWVQGWPEHSRELLVRDLLADPGGIKFSSFFCWSHLGPVMSEQPIRSNTWSTGGPCLGKGSPNSAPTSGLKMWFLDPWLTCLKCGWCSLRLKKTDPSATRKRLLRPVESFTWMIAIRKC